MASSGGRDDGPFWAGPNDFNGNRPGSMTKRKTSEDVEIPLYGYQNLPWTYDIILRLIIVFNAKITIRQPFILMIYLETSSTFPKMRKIGGSQRYDLENKGILPLPNYVLTLIWRVLGWIFNWDPHLRQPTNCLGNFLYRLKSSF